MIIHKIPLELVVKKHLDTQLHEPTNKNSIKVVKPTNKKTVLQNFGD